MAYAHVRLHAQRPRPCQPSAWAPGSTYPRVAAGPQQLSMLAGTWCRRQHQAPAITCLAAGWLQGLKLLLGSFVCIAVFLYLSSDWSIAVFDTPWWVQPHPTGTAVAHLPRATRCLAARLPSLTWRRARPPPGRRYLAQPVWRRLLTMTVVGTCYRNRYYFVWVLAEACMSLAGLDFLGWDDKVGARARLAMGVGV